MLASEAVVRGCLRTATTTLAKSHEVMAKQSGNIQTSTDVESIILRRVSSVGGLAIEMSEWERLLCCVFICSM